MTCIAPPGHVCGGRYVDVRTASGYTPLHFAVAVDSVQCVRVLVAYGAGIHYYNMFRCVGGLGGMYACVWVNVHACACACGRVHVRMGRERGL